MKYHRCAASGFSTSDGSPNVTLSDGAGSFEATGGTRVPPPQVAPAAARHFEIVRVLAHNVDTPDDREGRCDEIRPRTSSQDTLELVNREQFEGQQPVSRGT